MSLADDIENLLKEQARQIFERALRIFVDDVKADPLVPVDTGNLRESVSVTGPVATNNVGGFEITSQLTWETFARGNRAVGGNTGPGADYAAILNEVEFITGPNGLLFAAPRTVNVPVFTDGFDNVHFEWFDNLILSPEGNQRWVRALQQAAAVT